MRMASCRSSLVPDNEQVIVNIGPAEVWCLGGTIADPGTGALVQVIDTDQAAQAVVEYHHVWVGHSYLEVPFSPPEESEEQYEP